MKYKIIISAPYIIPVLEKFKSRFIENNIDIQIANVKERLEEIDILSIGKDADGFICGDDKFTKNVLHQCKKLKVISKWGTGIDSIDQEECKKLGIKVMNTPNAFTIPVSDSVLGYILAFSRNLLPMNEAMHNGEWKKIPGKALHESTLGVIGVGNVGESVLRKAKAFGMKLYGNDIKKIPSDIVIELDIHEVSLDELLINCDFVSVNCDLNPTSYHLLNEKAFGKIKPGAYIINTARGPIIDERSMIIALQEKILAGAALDVFEDEPLPADSPLKKMKNVLLAPHNSNSSPYAWEFIHINTINNLFSALGINSKIS
jgi:D-3-phosphoglycerate dehydrogenase / 2-oxoglutarate reductase